MTAADTKRQSFRSQYGRRGISVSSPCPTYAISRKLGNVHVKESDAYVEDMIRTAPGIDKDPRWTDKMVDEAVRFALWRHHENRAEYRAVMSGSIGR
jgi:hypothetical protein